MKLPPLTRRRALVLGAGATAAAAGPAVFFLSRSDGATTGPTRHDKTDIAPPLPTSCLQVVAHADDDLYFMNPEVAQTVRSGATIVTVYLTAGESDGRNVFKDAPNAAKTTADRPGFAAARQYGARGAYAKMATGNRAAAWKRETIATADGAVAEIDTLVDAPRVQLVWLSIKEAGAIQTPMPNSLRSLWEGTVPNVATLPPKHGPVTPSYRYTREGLVTTLVDLMRKFRPTVLRTLDPDPEHTVTDGKSVVNDHQDHTAAALFAVEALRRYEKDANRPHVVVESYRGYSNAVWPHNQSAAALADKIDLLSVYGWTDQFDCRDSVGCGDRKVGGKVAVYNWAESTYHRYPGSTSWLQRGGDNRLRAFGVSDGQVVMWTEGDGGAWAGPAVVGAGPFAPFVTAVRLSDGRIRLFAVRMAPAGAPNGHVRELATAVVSASGVAGSWTALGNPAGGDAVAGREIGMPAAVVLPSGGTAVFVRNADYGISFREARSGDDWGAWTALGGKDVQDGLSVVATAQGGVEVFAATRKGVGRWRRAAGAKDFTEDTSGALPVPAGPVTAYGYPDGRVALYARQPDTARILVHTRGKDGTWSTQPRDLAGPGGTGAPLVLPLPGGRTAVVVRTDKGGTGVAGLSDRDPQWLDFGGLMVHLPSAATTPSGGLVLAAIGPDGRLRVRTAASLDNPPAPGSDWTAVGT
jgi:LmbE family N-acetylglucosaminyl deacetylase